ncbi:MAG: helix-turn-helix transcriptional regulator [Butyrivibrio sp.]|nr:helix-turn-helix transcriptional regulator [Butyrivibrio sp.]
MLDRSRMGEFIVSIREELGLTQQQLASSVGVSDKVIANWETGKGIPDTMIMPELCRILDVSVNELLAGERLTGENYNQKADDNIVDLLRNSEDIKKDYRGVIIGIVAGVCLLIVFAVVMINLSGSAYILSWFLNLSSLLAIIGIYLAVLGISGQFAGFFRSFGLLLRHKNLTDEEISKLAQKSEYALDIGIRGTVIGGFMASIMGTVILMRTMSDPAHIGPYVEAIALTLFYAGILALIMLIIKGRIHKLML